MIFFNFNLTYPSFISDELPSPVIEGPDKNGIKTVTEYVDEDGKKFKVFFFFDISKKMSQIKNGLNIK